MNGKFLTVLLLALSMILISCGGDNLNNDGDGFADGLNGGGVGEEIAGVEQPPDPRDIPDEVPDNNFGGADFRILHRTSCTRSNWALYDVHQIEIAAESLNGDVINDALFNRNKTIEDRFNINIVSMPYPQSGNDENAVTSFARRSIQSESDDFDLIVSRYSYTADLASAGLLTDWNSLPHLDTSKPWWIKDAMDEFTINGRTYLAMSDIIFPGVIGEAAFIMFNKDLLQTLGLESPYAMVEENRWTIDILSDIVRECYSDTNGDAARDVEDTYGFTSDAWGSAYAWMWALGNRATSKDPETGLPYYDLFTERNASSLNKVHDLFYNNPGSAVTNARGNSINFRGLGDQAYLFSQGNTLFMLDRVGVLCTPDYRNAPFEFGIVPIPKYDESQAKYLTMINEHASAMSIPAYNKNHDMTGSVIEALSAESHKQLVPAYYEVALKIKYSRDEESVRMLDLIFDGVVYDFALLYNINTFDIYQTILRDERDPNTFASQIERDQPRAESALERILDLYAGID
ncbi:MAG: extracellular solute-binding protein [Oscillospiraceae bacterium]|nr:extracellular solute-binding protein [Oscillospiraceae bacterium]